MNFCFNFNNSESKAVVLEVMTVLSRFEKGLTCETAGFHGNTYIILGVKITSLVPRPSSPKMSNVVRYDAVGLPCSRFVGLLPLSTLPTVLQARTSSASVSHKEPHSQTTPRQLGNETSQCMQTTLYQGLYRL